MVTTNPGATVLGFTNPGQTHTYIFSGQTFTTTDPDTTVVNTTTNSTFSGGNGGVAFVKGTDCLSAPAGTDWPGDPGGASVQWQGAPSAWSSFITNGGLQVNGANAHTAGEIWVGKHNASGCENYQGGWKVTGPPPGSTPCSASGTPASTCPYIHGPFSPLDWPLPPPSPAPPAGCLPTGTSGITGGWTATHPPGVYCYTAGALTLSANGATFDGYSFYAPSISATSNGMIFNPSLTCGTRKVLFDAYDGNLNLGGNSDQLKGDMYATNGEISVTGGGSFAGCGFMETLKLIIGGNFAGYQGTGPGAGGGIVSTTTVSTTTVPGGTHTTTDADTTSVTTDPDTVVTGSTTPGNTFTATTGTNIGLGE